MWFSLRAPGPWGGGEGGGGGCSDSELLARVNPLLHAVIHGPSCWFDFSIRIPSTGWLADNAPLHCGMALSSNQFLGEVVFNYAPKKNWGISGKKKRPTLRYMGGAPPVLLLDLSRSHGWLRVRVLGGDTACPLQVCQLSRSSESTHFLSLTSQRRSFIRFH